MLVGPSLTCLEYLGVPPSCMGKKVAANRLMWVLSWCDSQASHWWRRAMLTSSSVTNGLGLDNLWASSSVRLRCLWRRSWMPFWSKCSPSPADRTPRNAQWNDPARAHPALYAVRRKLSFRKFGQGVPWSHNAAMWACMKKQALFPKS